MTFSGLPTSLDPGQQTSLGFSYTAPGSGPIPVTTEIGTATPETDTRNNNANGSTDITTGSVGQLTGTVYRDRNHDGQFDAGDTPLAGVTVRVTTSTGGIVTLITDGNGNYGANVPTGATSVDVVDDTLPQGLVLTTNIHDQGHNPAQATVTSGSPATADFGYIPQPPTPVPGLSDAGLAVALLAFIALIGWESRRR